MDKLTLVLLDLIRSVGARVTALLRQPVSTGDVGGRGAAAPRTSTGVKGPVHTPAPDVAAGAFWNLDASYERLFTPVEATALRNGGRLVTAGPTRGR